MPPIRIAHVVEATTGGVARHVIDLVTHLDRSEFELVLYLSFKRPDSWKDSMRALRDDGMLLREIPMARIPNPSAVNQLAGWAQRDAIDLLHLHSAKAGYLGRLAAKSLDIPVVYTPHAFPFQRTTDWLHPLYRRVERQLAAQTAAIICVSKGEKEEAVKAGLPADRMVVIPNGIDLTHWPLPAAWQREKARRELGITREELIVGAMGRLVPQKGMDLLLQSAEEILPEGFPHVSLMIWGDGPERRHLLEWAERLRVKRVIFAGKTDNPWQAFAAMDIYCNFARWEGGPYTVLEAMACGVPVVASMVPGNADYVIDGQTGRVVPTDLPGPGAVALHELLIDADLRQDYGAAGRRRVEQKYTLERMVRTTAELYRCVLGLTAEKPTPPADQAESTTTNEQLVIPLLPESAQSPDQ
ncbi:MAG: glycosyltransferase [Armatimonadota bacterium]